jgi:hypothetical protein
MAKKKQSIDEHISEEKKRHIDNVLATVYARGANGYGLTRKIANIEEFLDLPEKKDDGVDEDLYLRVDLFKAFVEDCKSPKIRSEIQSLARTKKISLEEAYKLQRSKAA